MRLGVNASISRRIKIPSSKVQTSHYGRTITFMRLGRHVVLMYVYPVSYTRFRKHQEFLSPSIFCFYNKPVSGKQRFRQNNHFNKPQLQPSQSSPYEDFLVSALQRNNSFTSLHFHDSSTLAHHHHHSATPAAVHKKGNDIGSSRLVRSSSMDEKETDSPEVLDAGGPGYRRHPGGLNRQKPLESAIGWHDEDDKEVRDACSIAVETICVSGSK
ncbi:hypothetical protein L1887_05037 [Cichorium endivia]|nr:hypothetical protein L1887_05037 [Cichorium endivia]